MSAIVFVTCLFSCGVYLDYVLDIAVGEVVASSRRSVRTLPCVCLQ